MTRQIIAPGTFEERDEHLNSNFKELFQNKETPVANDGTFTFIYADNVGVNESGNVRFQITNDSKIEVKRYDASQSEGNEWVLIAVIGSLTSEYLNLIGDNPRMFSIFGNKVLTYIRKTQSIADGIDVGDMDAITYISSNDIPKLVIKDSTVLDTLYFGETEIKNASICTVEYISDVFCKINKLHIKCDNPIGKVRICVYNDASLNEDSRIYASHSDWSFYENDKGFELTSGINTIDLLNHPLIDPVRKPITLSSNLKVYIQFESLTDLSLIGETILINSVNTFVPVLQIERVKALTSTIASEEYVQTQLKLPEPRIKAIMSHNLSINDTTETIINFNNIIENQDISLINGVFTVLKAGLYTGEILAYINESANPYLAIWVERQLYNAETETYDPWTICGTFAKILITNDGGESIPLSTCYNFNANDRFRIKTKVLTPGSTIDFQANTINVDLGTLTQPSASVFIYRTLNKLN